MMWGSSQKYAPRDVRRRMKPLLDDGLGVCEIARRLGVSHAAVSQAIARAKRPAGKPGRPRKTDD